MSIDGVADRLDADAQEFPLWTIRCTWRVTDSRDEPFRTYHSAECEAGALDRAVFVLDHYRRESAGELVCVDVLYPGGWWADIPCSSADPSSGATIAAQRVPGEG